MIRSNRLLLALGALAVISGSLAFAGEGRAEDALRGKFRFTSIGACTESPGGFTPRPFVQSLGGPLMYHESYSGTMEFDGKGNAVQTLRGMTLFDGPFFPSNILLGSFVATCRLTYAMIDELSFALAGSCSGTLPDGPAANQTYVLTGSQSIGQISRDGETILISATEPLEQEITLSGGYTAKRYCINTTTLMRGVKRP